MLTSAWVFIRHQAIPPLRGGAGQALPNLQTTPRDHPHPASRPMTLGHFTSWRADDRGYYTGVGYTPAELDHSFGAPMCPAWCNCDIQYMIQRDRKRDREQSEREREELVTFLGQLPGQMWEYTDTSVTYEGASWGHLGPSWGHLGPSWGPLGLAWSQLGALLVRLGPPWPLLGCFVRKSQAKRWFSKNSAARFGPRMVFWA